MITKMTRREEEEDNNSDACKVSSILVLFPSPKSLELLFFFSLSPSFQIHDGMKTKIREER